MLRSTSDRTGRRRRQVVTLAVATAGIAAGAQWSPAGTYLYDVGQDAQAGTGTWNAATGAIANWLSNGVGSDVVWPNSGADAAIFGTIGSTEVDAIAVSGTVKAGSLQFNGGNYTLNAGAINVSSAAATINVASGVTATINSAFVGTSTATLSYNGGTGGTLIFGGSNSYGGATTITSGVLSYGAGSTFTGGAALNVNAGVGSSSTVNVNTPGNTIFFPFLNVGQGLGTGNVNVVAGTLSGTGNFYIGRTAGGFANVAVTGGSYVQTGTALVSVGMNGYATLTVSGGGSFADGSTANFSIAQGAASIGVMNVADTSTASAGAIYLVGNAGHGALNLSGTTASVTSPLVSIGSAAGSLGVADVSGGALNQSGTSTNLRTGDAGAGILSVRGTGTVNAPGGLVIANASGGTGTVNLLPGGTINAKSVAKGSGSSATFDFNGGTLATVTGGSVGFLSGLSNAYVYGGGAVINTAAADATIAQPLLAAPGSGLTAISYTTGGTGYTVAPIVQITGGGTGATAVAYVDSTTHALGFTITNPGTGYTTGSAPTITLYNASSSGPTSGFSVTAAINTVGGLTKLGGNTLTLTGASTYGGATNVSAGTLRVNGSTLSTGDVQIASGATLGGNGSVGSVTVNGKITAGPDAATVGNLSTGVQTWASGGSFEAKFANDNLTNDRLLMTGLTYSGSPFTVNLTGANPSLPAGNYVLAWDKGAPAAADPFLASSLSLTLNNVPADPAFYNLSSEPDGGGTGVDLVLSVAAPEPTSLMLGALAAAPLLGRRRRRTASV